MKAHPLLLEDQRDAAHLHNGNEVFVPRFGSVDFRAECSSKEPFPVCGSHHIAPLGNISDNQNPGGELGLSDFHQPHPR